MAADCPASPIDRRTAAASRTTSWPSTRARPASGSSSVVRIRTAVVLPAPFGPRTPSTVPCGTDRSIPRSARTSPNDLVRPSTRIAGPEVGSDSDTHPPEQADSPSNVRAPRTLPPALPWLRTKNGLPPWLRPYRPPLTFSRYDEPANRNSSPRHPTACWTVRAQVWWGGLMDAAELARRFGLGRAARLSDGPAARGKQGLVWRLDTADGSWAVKEPLRRSDEDEVRAATSFQEAACAAGVPAPRVRRTTEGCVFATVDGRQVRVYEWVDLRAPDTGLDPAQVGAIVAAIHRVPATDSGPLHPWYHEPVGAERWDQLVEQLREAGAPFAGRLAGLRDELVALESWIEPPQLLRTCHRDLWADNVLPTADGGVCVIDWENSGPADPSQELGCVLFAFASTDPGRARALIDAYRQAD